MTAAAARTARMVRVTGQVQGVGFRPFVHRLAIRHGLAGWVRNTAGQVEIEVEGDKAEVDCFLTELVDEAPPLAIIDRVAIDPAEPDGLDDFAILDSALTDGQRLAPPPDVATCPSCERELFDPDDRRFHYPFITCTDCGPRYTVIDAMPYDRERTAMAPFRQCPACAAEYHSPGDRRHHSETNSCPVCGPTLSYLNARGEVSRGRVDPLSWAASLVLAGGILAVKGLGGFQLAADATNPSAVGRLRRRKAREAKPLAVMVRTLDQARAVALVSDREAEELVSPASPIVLLIRRDDSPLAESVSPGLETVGVMLAPSPLHHLLLERIGRPVVMTSGNASDEPIAIGNDEALDRLAGIADGYLLHDREIRARYDDSVLRVVDDHPVLIRRARGFAPRPLTVPIASPVPLVAVGPHLKNTFCLVDGDRAVVSQHVGDLENLETLDHFTTTLAAHRRLFGIDPARVACDLHPGYLSTRVATDLALGTPIAVQHHHAHIAAVLAEHGETGPVIGVGYDGTGYGDDGTIWGGEVLQADLTGYRRLAHLRPVPLPGGDLAARRPWRSAVGWGVATGLLEDWNLDVPDVSATERAVAIAQARRGINAPLTSSMGRLFDAAAAILGVRLVAGYEGQAAMELESLAARRPAGEHPCDLVEKDGVTLIDPRPLLGLLAARRARGADIADLAADFHASIAWVSELVVRRAVEATGLTTVVLGGGVFLNARLLGSLRHRLEAAKLRVLLPRRLGPGDGAVSFGQAAVAAARLAHH